MPRDCTASAFCVYRMYSPGDSGIPYSQITGPIALAMQKSQKKKSVKSNDSKKKTQLPASFATQRSNRPAKVTSSPGPDARITVRHTEYLGPVTGTAVFQPTSYPINPGLVGTFPWLSSIASCYEFYQFKELSLEFRPLCGTGNSGGVLLAVDFDALDSAPTTIQKMMTYQTATQGPVYMPATIRCPPSNMTKFGVQKFVRHGSNPAASDLKTYDIGKFWVGTESTNEGFHAGNLLLHYEVILSNPHTPTAAPWDSSASIHSITASNLNPFQGAVFRNGSVVAPIVEAEDSRSFWLAPGQYLFDIDFLGEALSALEDPATYILNTDPSFVLRDLGNRFANAASTTLLETVRATLDEGGWMSLAVPAGWTALTGFVWRITPYAAILP